jgi:hypothetical protein
MAGFLDALLALGATAVLSGDAPTTAKEYASRVRIVTGERPTFSEVKAKLAELSKPSADAIKAEAGRRITERYPVHAQLNMLARAWELNIIGADNWSEDERVEVVNLQDAFLWIKAVRAASNSLETLAPANYQDDAHWPARQP